MTNNNNIKINCLIKGIDWNENAGVTSLRMTCRNLGFLVSMGYLEYLKNIRDLGRTVPPALWDTVFKEISRELDQEVGALQGCTVLDAQGLYLFIRNLPEDLRNTLWGAAEDMAAYIEHIWLDEGGVWEIHDALKGIPISKADMFVLVEEAARSPIRFMLNRHLTAVAQGKGAPAYELGFFSNGLVSLIIDVIDGKVTIDAVGAIRINGQPLTVKRKKEYIYCSIPEFLKVMDDNPLRVEFKPKGAAGYILLKRC